MRYDASLTEVLEEMSGEQSGRPGGIYECSQKNKEAPQIFFRHGASVYSRAGDYLPDFTHQQSHGNSVRHLGCRSDYYHFSGRAE